MKIWVDPRKCEGHNRCVARAPDVFRIDEEGYSSAPEGHLSPESEEDARQAIRECPERAISIIAR